ncbi:TadE/TadG family type IV pilus assembly protein [Litoreibacter arenae]|uniref:ABC-type dipeptide transport system, periplasmic component n=1 Tax=Litoreibacter arenae DSM 19593 TaxID=1123360 RepID=S9QHG5_9RHOB|nr:hypothetical protein [Litoreibacter arenae]EPX80906.1 ABC-type dipeptide transport system, periplasmic component [Litoreibacter arenae DSM 19593]
MMTSLKKLTAPIARFVRDTRASATVEAVLIMPLLMAWFVGSFVFFDGFKNRNTAMKASYTIGDILSRRTEGATAQYIDNLQDLFDSLAYTSGSSAIRVTSLTWNGKKHRVLWSHSTKSKLPVHTNDTVRGSAFRNRIPLMAVAETVILVETFIDYNPAFNVGWSHHLFENFVVTSPRFASCLSWDNGVDVPHC